MPSETRGCTVVELAITLGIASIVAAMALPTIDFNQIRIVDDSTESGA